MRVPVRWLRDYVEYPWSVDELAHRLTMSGLKVETIERPGELWGDVLIGEVRSLGRHPTSNKPLWVAHVFYGEGTATVVTGAPNLHVGARAPIVLAGGSVPVGPGGGQFPIEARPMAGITSQGMLCSARELALGEDHAGILLLPAEAPVGAALATYLGEEVLDIETVSNRPDTLSIVGVAREVAALIPAELRLPPAAELPPHVRRSEAESVEIEIAAPDLCPRFSMLRIDGVSAVPSPEWLARRLDSAGMRPITLLVDLTNYVMLEMGQPMHAFDAAQVAGGRIVVRRATAGETLTTLDGIERSLGPDDLVIADGARALGIAGVMGGEHSEIRPETSSIVLESANFDAPSIRRTAQSLGLRTDASSRFEKGLPIESTVPAIERYVHLLSEISGDPLTVSRISDVWSRRPATRVVDLRLSEIPRLLGIDVPRERVAGILTSLGFDISIEGDTLHAVVPPWRRVDIERAADLVEEVGRIVGFDEIPSTLPFRTLQPPMPPPEWTWEGRLRERLLGAGITEAMTHTLTSPQLAGRMSRENGPSWESLIVNPHGVLTEDAEPEPVRLSNPASNDRQMMRVTLVPSLLDVVSRNLRSTDERVAFFELARTYFNRREVARLPYERRTLAIALSGRRNPVTWRTGPPEPHSFWDIKGLVEAVLAELRIDGYTVEPCRHPALHPGRSAAVVLGDDRPAYFGELHPDVAARFEIDNWPSYVAEMDLDVLFRLAGARKPFEPLPRYPAANRDLAVVVGVDVPAAAIVRVVHRAGAPALESARIFDVYQGNPLPEGKRSVAVALTFRLADRTLRQDEVDAFIAAIIDALRGELRATLRE